MSNIAHCTNPGAMLSSCNCCMRNTQQGDRTVSQEYFPGRSNRIALLLIGLLAFFTSLPTAGAPENSAGEPKNNATPPASKKDSRKTIVLEQYEPDMPPGTGRQTFMVRCMVCHSARYVTMQPEFPAKVWEKTVDKMIKNFGAHITPAEAKEIVAYLVAIKGKKAAVPK